MKGRIIYVAFSLILAGCGGQSTSGDSLYQQTSSVNVNSQQTLSGTANQQQSPSNTTSQQFSGVATLSWTAPATRIDGTSLAMSEIAGYKIYVRDSANALIAVTEISDAYTMEYKISVKNAGTYYFSVAAFDQNLVESDSSDPVSKTFI